MPYSRFTKKEDKLAKRIMQEYINKGYPKKRAKSIGYATVVRIKNKSLTI